MKTETKQKIKEASAKADAATDKALLPIMESAYSWLILGASHFIAFAIGAFFF